MTCQSRPALFLTTTSLAALTAISSALFAAEPSTQASPNAPNTASASSSTPVAQPPTGASSTTPVAAVPVHGGIANTSPAQNSPAAFQPANAQSTPTITTLSEETDSTGVVNGRWYGWQTLLLDATAIVITPMALYASDEPFFAYAGAASYVLATPILHARHGNNLTAMGSGMMRVGLPLAGLLLGGAACSKSEDEGFEEAFDTIGCMALGGGLGILSASLIDATVLSYDDAPKPKTQTATRFLISPTVSVTPKGSTFALVGSF